MKASQASIAEAQAKPRRTEYLPISELKPAARNPKRQAQGELSKSIGRFGFTEPVVLDERTGRLVAGHGRIDALKEKQQRLKR